MTLPKISLPRRDTGRSPSPLQDELKSPHKKQQQLLTDLPKALQQLQKQSVDTQRAVSEQVGILSQQQQISEQQLELTKRMIDQLDRLTLETRVTNVLLAELVAIHQSVVPGTEDIQRAIVRQAAYEEASSKYW